MKKNNFYEPAPSTLRLALRPYFLQRFVFLIFAAFFGIMLFGSNISAQELPTTEIAPPPLKILSKGEKEQLDKEVDIKKRTKLALDFMEGRLKKAEEFDMNDQFAEMYDELGKFHALVDYTLNFLNRNDTGSGKSLNNFKRFELGIRPFTPRLEVVRRNLPLKYEQYVRNLIKNLRDSRSKAVDAFFGDTVVPNNRNN